MDQKKATEKVATSIFRRSRADHSVARERIWPGISNSSKLLCISSLPANLKRIRSKTAEKSGNSVFPYKSMGFFSDAQGQLTLKSVVGSRRISNYSELSRMPSLPVSMKRIG